MPGTSIQVCDIVRYQEKLWRVTYHKKRVEDTLTSEIPSDDIDKIIHDVLFEEFIKEKKQGKNGDCQRIADIVSKFVDLKKRHTFNYMD